VKSEARRTCHCPDRERESARAREVLGTEATL
jgi:hypothetical protein